MNQIKIVPDLQPWEVMKRASEGEQSCIQGLPTSTPGEYLWAALPPGYVDFNWKTFTYAIIDTTAPQIDWDKFDWKFFEQYGDLTCYTDRVNGTVTYASHDYMVENSFTPIGVQPSPFYYWPGGAQPVPGNVEVEIIGRNGATHTDSAMELPWYHNGMSADIIAFRITGEIE